MDTFSERMGDMELMRREPALYRLMLQIGHLGEHRSVEIGDGGGAGGTFVTDCIAEMCGGQSAEFGKGEQLFGSIRQGNRSFSLLIWVVYDSK